VRSELDGLGWDQKLRKKREMAAREFFKLYLTTSLSKDEMVLEASIPATPPEAGCSLMEFARRNGDFAIVGVAVLLTREQDRIADARIALTGVGDKPWRESGVDEMLVGQRCRRICSRRLGRKSPRE